MLLIAVLLPCALAAVPMMELTQARRVQTAVDMGKPIEEIFETFKAVHRKYTMC